jgi:hypothetical protein
MRGVTPGRASHVTEQLISRLRARPLSKPHAVGNGPIVNAARLVYRLLVVVGNSLTLIGCVGLLLSAIGVIPAESFAVGISSGIRVIGSVAVTGCLLSAIGYGVEEYLEK